MPQPIEPQYAAPGVLPTLTSKYSIASVIVSVANIVWFYGPMQIFDARKQDRVAMMIGLLGILLAIAGYRQSHYKRGLAVVGFCLGLVGLLLTFVFPTL